MPERGEGGEVIRAMDERKLFFLWRSFLISSRQILVQRDPGSIPDVTSVDATMMRLFCMINNLFQCLPLTASSDSAEHCSSFGLRHEWALCGSRECPPSPLYPRASICNLNRLLYGPFCVSGICLNSAVVLCQGSPALVLPSLAHEVCMGGWSPWRGPPASYSS